MPAVSKFAPRSDRDPFLSHIEVQKKEEQDRRKELARLEEERRRREEEEARREALRPKPKAKPNLPPMEERLVLQGIIATAGERQAIVNNEVKRIGESVLGAKISKITDTAVFFSYQGRTIRKVVAR